MRIIVSQIYIQAGVSYPFSHRFQKYVSEELTRRIAPSEQFLREYATDFDLVFNMSAKAGIAQREIRGPTVFRDTKDVEFTIFLPFDTREPLGQDVYRKSLSQLISGIVEVLRTLQMDVSNLLQDADSIVERIVADPKMIDEG